MGLCMAYFEIFYAWARVHMHSVFGNFIKEVGLRLFSVVGLLGIYFNWITAIDFIYLTAVIYFVAFLVTMLYAFKVMLFKVAGTNNVSPIFIV